MLKIEINTENAAFKDENNEFIKEEELVRILKKITREIELGKTGYSIFDINGNKCGFWELTED